MRIEKLVEVISPPDAPFETGSSNEWDRVQKEIGTELPEDYYDLGRTYGSGRFLNGELQIVNPLSPSYLGWMSHELSKLHSVDPSDLHNAEGDSYCIFPDDEGLYPFGRDYNGNRFYWRTEGNPDQWPIVCRSESYEFEEVQCTLTEFLTLLVTNALDITYFRYWGYAELPKEARTFVPEQLRPSKKKPKKKKASKTASNKKKT